MKIEPAKSLQQIAQELTEQRRALEYVGCANVWGKSAQTLVDLEVMKQRTLRKIAELNEAIETAPDTGETA